MSFLPPIEPPGKAEIKVGHWKLIHRFESDTFTECEIRELTTRKFVVFEEKWLAHKAPGQVPRIWRVREEEAK